MENDAVTLPALFHFLKTRKSSLWSKIIQRQLTPESPYPRILRQNMTDMSTHPRSSFFPLYTLLALGLVAIALLVSSALANEPVSWPANCRASPAVQKQPTATTYSRVYMVPIDFALPE